GAGPAAGPGRPALVGAAARARRGDPGPGDPAAGGPGPGVAVPALAAGGRAARPAPAVRAARHGGNRTDAAPEPDDDAAQRHDLVDPAAGRPGPGAGGSRVSRLRAGRAHAPRVRAPRPRPHPAGAPPALH